MDKPANVIVLLLDSLNRHMLSAYGGTEFGTPNIDRLAARSLKFTTHYTGALPCMPGAAAGRGGPGNCTPGTGMAGNYLVEF